MFRQLLIPVGDRFRVNAKERLGCRPGLDQRLERARGLAWHLEGEVADFARGSNHLLGLLIEKINGTGTLKPAVRGCEPERDRPAL